MATVEHQLHMVLISKCWMLNIILKLQSLQRDEIDTYTYNLELQLLLIHKDIVEWEKCDLALKIGETVDREREASCFFENTFINVPKIKEKPIRILKSI